MQARTIWLVETMGIEPTTPCLQSRSEAVRAMSERAGECRLWSVSSSRKSWSAGVRGSQQMRSGREPAWTAREDAICGTGYVRGYVVVPC